MLCQSGTLGSEQTSFYAVTQHVQAASVSPADAF